MGDCFASCGTLDGEPILSLPLPFVCRDERCFRLGEMACRSRHMLEHKMLKLYSLMREPQESWESEPTARSKRSGEPSSLVMFQLLDYSTRNHSSIRGALLVCKPHED